MFGLPRSCLFGPVGWPALYQLGPDRPEFEQHFLRGMSRTRTRVGLALAVMMALTLGQVHAGRPDRIRSLYGPAPCAFAGGRLWADTG